MSRGVNKSLSHFSRFNDSNLTDFDTPKNINVKTFFLPKYMRESADLKK